MRTKGMPGPKKFAAAFKQSIPRSLEKNSLGQAVDCKTVSRQPFGKMRRFGAPLQAAKITQNGRASINQRGVGGENQIRQARNGLDRSHLRDIAHQLLEPSPLLRRPVCIGGMELPFHPGIDDVLDTEVGRGTKEKTRSIQCSSVEFLNA